MLKDTDYRSLAYNIEQSFIFLVTWNFHYNFIRSLVHDLNAVNSLYLLDQTLIYLLFLFRRSASDVSPEPKEHIVLVAGTFLPLLAAPSSGLSIIPTAISSLIMIIGIFIHLNAKLTIRRSFGYLAANHGVKIVGPYSFVRHPIYLGNILVQISLILNGPFWWNCILFPITWGFYILRIMAEEGILDQNDD